MTDRQDARSAAQDQREVVGYEVVVRFFPGSGTEAHRYWTQLGWPDEQVEWVRLDRIVVPDGEERVREGMRSRSGAVPDAASKQLHWLEEMERIEQEVFPDARPRSEVVVPCTCPAHEARPQTDPDCPLHGGDDAAK